MGLLYLQPTGSHDLAFHDEKFERVCIGSEYSRKRWARHVAGIWGSESRTQILNGHKNIPDRIG
jgi:hypothetical protein